MERSKGGKQARVGSRFFDEVEKIKDARLRNGKSKERISSEKITNLIVRHVMFKQISEEIINSKEEDVNNYGK